MPRDTLVSNVDGALLERLAQLSPGGQRWLKTVIHAVRAFPDEDDEREEEEPPQSRPQKAGLSSGLEDVITGKASLKDQLDTYPELAEELEGLGEIIDMLRDLGEHRRNRGEQILREEILGERREGVTEDDEDFTL